MIRALALVLALFTPQILAAQDSLPALYDVTGVAADDFLNIRAAPDATASQIGQLAPDATAVEVVALSPDGTWAQVNTWEWAGWVALRFLRRAPGPDWFALQSPIACHGTEPFWNLAVNMPLFRADFLAPDRPALSLKIADVWPGAPERPVAALLFDANSGAGMAVIRHGQCSDGMSDKSYALIVDVFLRASDDSTLPGPALSGCCSIQP